MAALLDFINYASNILPLFLTLHTEEEEAKYEHISPSLSSSVERRFFRDTIEIYAQEKNLCVTYHTVPLDVKGRGRHMYVSTVVIKNQKYNSYPNDMPTIELAEEEAAKVAVEALDLIADKESKYFPICMETMDYKTTVLRRILNIIHGKSNGLWSTKVESLYKERYNEALPSNWLEIVNSDININKIGHNRSILYPVQRNRMVANVLSDEVIRSEDVIPKPLLTPDNEYWDIYVSYLTSVVDVFIQLVVHSESYQNIVEEMQFYYENNGDIARRIEDDKLYAVNDEDYWLRVRVTNIMGDKVECYFVDYGNSEIIDRYCLFELLPRFSTLPFQALHCQLDGLEKYSRNKIMLHHLTDKNLLLGKTLVAKVISRMFPLWFLFHYVIRPYKESVVTEGAFNHKVSSSDNSSSRPPAAQQIVPCSLKMLCIKALNVWSFQHVPSDVTVKKTIQSMQVPYIGCGGLLGTGLSQDQLNKVQRFPLITDLNDERTNCNEDTIGFFIAKFKKN